MKAIKSTAQNTAPIQDTGTDFFEKVWDQGWVYIKTIIDLTKGAALVLDKNFTVLIGNEAYYHLFTTTKKDTVATCLFDLHAGQWNIPELKPLLKKVLPQSTFFSGFEIPYAFPDGKKKVLLLSARKIYYQHIPGTNDFLPLILVSFEDITEIMSVANSLARHMNQLHHLGTTNYSRER
jgi:hypothetical protein